MQLHSLYYKLNLEKPFKNIAANIVVMWADY